MSSQEQSTRALEYVGESSYPNFKWKLKFSGLIDVFLAILRDCLEKCRQSHPEKGPQIAMLYISCVTSSWDECFNPFTLMGPKF